MNFIKRLFFGLLLTSVSVFSQSNYGSNRNLRSEPTPNKPTAQEIQEQRNEHIDKYIAKLKAELNLDALQEIAIKNEILSNTKNVDIVMKKEDSPEAKSTEVKALIDKTEVIINSYLNKEQKEKYLIFKENSKSKKKDKKGKKEDKSTEE